jgi:glycerol-3-phosphate cytidylyltransferase
VNRVVTIGTFDILHRGHLRLLQKCVQIAGGVHHVTVGVNTDAFVEKYKGERPIMSTTDRGILIGALRGVFSWRTHDGNTLEFLSSFDKGPHFLVVGSDWAKKDYHAQIGVTKQQLEDLGFTLVYVDYTEDINSTGLRNALKKRWSWWEWAMRKGEA